MPVTSSVTMRAEPDDIGGTMRNVSIGGALFVIPGTHAPACGTGLEMSFRLPTGALIRVSSSVRWTKVGEPDGYTSIGLQFGSLNGPSRSFIEHYVEQVAAAGFDLGMRGDATAKYRLTFDTAGRLHVLLSGMISPEEARAFALMLEHRLQTRRSRRLQFEIDTRGLSVCCSETVATLRRCFETLAMRDEVFGLFVGNPSIALTQLLRAARESGIADNVFSVNGVDDANRIWQQMET